MRYQLLNSESDECVRLGMHYLTSQSREVYVDGTYVMPKNGFTDSKGNFRLRTQSTNNEYMPDVKDKVNGENFLRYICCHTKATNMDTNAYHNLLHISFP